MKVFYVVHIKDKVLSDVLEAIRFLCNPTEKQRAHVTVRGPYKRRIDVKGLNRKIAGDTIVIDGVGNFFDVGQRTVFFRCSSPELKNVWNKSDYPFNPHVTLYDNDSETFARHLFEVVSRYKYYLKFRVEELEAIQPRRGQSSFSLALAFNSELVRSVVGRGITAEDARSLSENRRLDLVGRLCKHLSLLSNQYQTLDLFPSEKSELASTAPSIAKS
jgi:hypothetical protein